MKGTLVTDRELIEAIRRGRPEAFETLYRRHKDAVFRYACAVSGSVADGEDLLQEAFLGLLRNARRLDPERRVLPYLLQTIRNRQIDGLRAFARRGRQLSELHSPISQVGADQSVVEEEQTAALSDALGALPAKQRDVLTLRIFGGLSYEEIAAEQAAPKATVRTRYRAAIDKLRQVLGRRIANE